MSINIVCIIIYIIIFSNVVFARVFLRIQISWLFSYSYTEFRTRSQLHTRRHSSVQFRGSGMRFMNNEKSFSICWRRKKITYFTVPSIIYYYHNRIRWGDTWALDDCPFSSAKNPLSPCYVMVFEQTLKTVRVRRFELLFLNYFLFLFDNKERKLAANIIMISIHIFFYLP